MAGGLRITPLDGPARAFEPSAGGPRSARYEWQAFAAAIRDVAAYCDARRRIPDEVWVGAENLSPEDYLATLAGALETSIASGRPVQVERRTGRFTAAASVAEDSPKLWSWPIFPEGFHAPRLMDLARLQSWTIKPAISH